MTGSQSLLGRCGDASALMARIYSKEDDGGRSVPTCVADDWSIYL